MRVLLTDDRRIYHLADCHVAYHGVVRFTGGEIAYHGITGEVINVDDDQRAQLRRVQDLPFTGTTDEERAARPHLGHLDEIRTDHPGGSPNTRAEWVTYAESIGLDVTGLPAAKAATIALLRSRANKRARGHQG